MPRIARSLLLSTTLIGTAVLPAAGAAAAPQSVPTASRQDAVIAAKAPTKIVVKANTTRPRTGTKLVIGGYVTVRSGKTNVPAKGIRVTLQVKTGNRWYKAISGTSDAKGLVGFTHVWTKKETTMTLRMVTAADKTRAASVSNVLVIKKG